MRQRQVGEGPYRNGSGQKPTPNHATANVALNRLTIVIINHTDPQHIKMAIFHFPEKCKS